MILNASLKEVWFKAIKSGGKKIEYRDMTDYWMNKLLEKSKYGNKSNEEIKEGFKSGKLDVHTKGWTQIKFFHGNDTMTFEIKDIKAISNTFAIFLGKRIS